MGAIQMVVDEQADLRLNYVADKIQIKIIKLTLLLPGGGIFAPPITYLRIRVCVCVYAC